MHKVFISYHHAADQAFKECLVETGKIDGIFIDRSVDTGDISEALSDQTIREKIRDEYLRDSTVTILLVGQETKGRKHVDWELYSSMIDGKVNKKSGILVVNLPSTGSDGIHAPHGPEEKRVWHRESASTSWYKPSRADLERTYPYMPERIIDNLASKAKISVVPWNKVTVPILRYLIEIAFRDRSSCQYDFSRPMRGRNSSAPRAAKALSIDQALFQAASCLATEEAQREAARSFALAARAAATPSLDRALSQAASRLATEEAQREVARSFALAARAAATPSLDQALFLAASRSAAVEAQRETARSFALAARAAATPSLDQALTQAASRWA